MKTKILTTAIALMITLTISSQSKKSFINACLTDTFIVNVNSMPYECIREAKRDSIRLSDRFDVSIKKDGYGYWLTSPAVRNPKYNDYGYFLKHGYLNSKVNVKKLTILEKNKHNIAEIECIPVEKISSTSISVSFAPFANMAYLQADHIFSNKINLLVNYGTGIFAQNEYFKTVSIERMSKIGLGIGYQVNKSNDQFVLSFAPVYYYSNDFSMFSCELMLLKNRDKVSFMMGFDPIMFITRVGLGIKF